MENFVLYDEIGKGNHSIVYKGRRKGTINFVAIHCIEKVKRPQITNRVRLTHELDHANVVHFHEWYETTNHLWLVVELCTGGSLETLISQDEHLPEAAVRKFGIDLVRGLHYIHSLGIIFCDLRPSKILLDGTGILKLDDFSLSKVEDEDLEELFQQFDGDSGSPDSSCENEKSRRPGKYLGSPIYMAPEVVDGGSHSMASDLWALGCLLYEMYTGKPPFMAELYSDLLNKILKHDFPAPRVSGPRRPKPSPEFCDILNNLLKKNSDERMDWNKLVYHPFWQGALVHPDEKDTSSAAAVTTTATIEEPQTQGGSDTMTSMQDLPTDTGISLQSSITGSAATTNLKKYSVIELTPDKQSAAERSLNRSQTFKTLKSDKGQGDRPQTSPEVTDIKEAVFSLSSRPRTTQNTTYNPDDHAVESSQYRKSQVKQSRKTTGRTSEMQGMNMGRLNRDRKPSDSHSAEMKDLIFTTWDLTVTQIIDNPKIQKVASLKWDSKALPMQVPSMEKVKKLKTEEVEDLLLALADTLSKAINDKSASSQRMRVQLLNYIACLANEASVAALMIRSKLVPALQQQIKSPQHLEIRCKAARPLGLMAHNIEELDETLSLTEVVTALTEVVRDHFRNGKLKQATLPALGELLNLIATQEEQKGREVDSWLVPSITYTMIIRCLREGEDAVVQHYAAKIIESVATTTGIHALKFSTNETGLLLWYLFNHSTADSLKITAISALSRITRHSAAIFQSVIDKVGLPAALDSLGVSISRVQQAIVAMIAYMLVEGTHLQKFLQDKELVQKVMRLLESPSVVIRGKVFLAIQEIIKNNTEMLLICCQSRLVMYMERDSRKQNSSKVDNQAMSDYLLKCLDMLNNYIIQALPQISSDAIEALNAVLGRKHPSTVQAKQLKTYLPLLPIQLHLVTSQIFRPRIINEGFMTDIGVLLSHLKSIDSGETSIESAIGAVGTDDFINTTLSIVEAVTQHPNILMEYHAVVAETILPPLAALVTSDNGDTRALCLRLFSEITSLFLTHENLAQETTITNTRIVDEIIGKQLLPQYEQILLDQDPLPSYGLKLLLALIERSPSYIRDIQDLNLVPVLFQVLVDHQNIPTSSAMKNILAILQTMVLHKETNMRLLYEQGLVDHLCNVFSQAHKLYIDLDDKTDNRAVTALLTTLLDLLLAVLKHVSNIVRLVLQTKKGGGEADTQGAESLLLTNKPFVELTSQLVHLLCHEDSEIQSHACNALSLMAQLFGGEHNDIMTVDSMECLSHALPKFDTKKQKLLLRVIKRAVTADKHNATMLKEKGHVLIDTIKTLAQTASSHADVAVSSLAADILKLVGIKM
ncbi:serine/threonine-protein kinase ULK4-like [Saccoglossus kowalevskii]|uniref:Serine/threonine-protein kinase ULK4-like n=1 Tax=Saccoglossus kowalevskii TaxID=10224 RepID=A0ABM0MT90_SACKO|nr:PREDICTED: serine/threonine-protein kinase ULK4-like [Saccoglossus kowalevskii]